MEVRSYNKELAYADMLFKRPFSNIEIERNGQTRSVQCIKGSRSRILKNLENPDKRGMYKLPVIIIERTGLQKNDDRLANVWNEVKYRTNSQRMNYNIFTPVPIDITYTVTIVSKYQSDIDMILSNFIPFFNKDLFFQCEHPKFTDLTYKNQVIMENTIQEDHIPEIEANQDDIVTATCTFTFKTFLFCGTLKKERVVKEIVQENISTIISVHPMEILSTYVYELTKNDVDNIDKFLIEHPDCKLSTILSIELTADVSTEVSVTTSSVISVEEEVSEGLIPPIHQIAFGFYDTPYTSAHVPFINEVDELCANGYDDKPGVDRMIMRVTNDVYDYALSSPYPSKDWEWPNVKK